MKTHQNADIFVSNNTSPLAPRPSPIAPRPIAPPPPRRPRYPT
jgi:hypothetical protein